jgi:hypothetical protein
VKASHIEGKIIKDKCLHQYEYNDNFIGCLCWTRTFIKCLANGEYIDAGAPALFEKVVTNLKIIKEGSGNLFEVPVDNGTFFTKDGRQYTDFTPA